MMRKEYDFSKATRNPYTRLLKKQISIRLEGRVLAYFKAMSEKTGVPYQTLINLYLRDCATSSRALNLKWSSVASAPKDGKPRSRGSRRQRALSGLPRR